MATQAEQPANQVAVVRQSLAQMAPEFKAALPPHIPPEKFTRVAMTAVQNTPELIEADRRSLFGSIIRLAQDGLLPDGREAALVIFNAKQGNSWVKKVQAMPMIAGILKRIRQSGEVAKVSAHVVYEHDEFVVKYGFDEDVEHSPPPLDKPRGKPIGAYATAVLKDGSRLLEVMSLEEIEKVRSVSRSGDKGPWASWWGEMARKTVMRRLSKRLPMSTDIEEQVFQRDETMTVDLTPRAPVPTMIDAPVSRLDAIESQIDHPPHDEVTGEIIEAEADEVEAQIEEQAAEPATLMEAVEQGLADEPSPGRVAAERIIAEIKAAGAIIDINTIESRARTDLESMDPADADAVREVIAARRAEINAAREKEGGQ